jgi:hydroxymethylglutaryl-CoA reductase (NADPH)
MKPISLFDIGKKATSPEEAVSLRQKLVSRGAESDYSHLFHTTLDLETVSAKNCENLIGSIEIPVGVAGPLLIKQLSHEVFIPLATTEGALVASVSRGCKALSLSGRASCLVEYKGMTRSPVFACQDGRSANELVAWIKTHESVLKKTAEATSSHLKYLSYQSWIRGRHVYLRLVFDTDEAMGMNMATIASDAVSREIVAASDGVKLIALSSNVCTDKKDSVINSLFGRGYWVQAECFIPDEVLTSVLKTTADFMLETHTAKNLVGSNLAGSLSQNGQVANILAAIYLATGQDPAHVVDGSKAFLNLEKTDGGLYVSLTLPSLELGTVGGGTYLPAQTEARKLIGNGNMPTATELASVVGAACLAGELSLLASLTTNTLAKAHKALGRAKQ